MVRKMKVGKGISARRGNGREKTKTEIKKIATDIGVDVVGVERLEDSVRAMRIGRVDATR